MQKFRQSSIVFEKPGYLSKKLKTLRSSSYHRVAEFFVTSCIYFAHISHLPMSTKGIFFILFGSWVICKNQERPGFYTLTETRFFRIFLKTQDQNKIKKALNTFL